MVRKMKRAPGGDRLREALERRYPAPEFALFHEVASGVGASGTRYLDALAMGLFPSRGLHFHGFEIKADRKDWLREKKTPEKAEFFGPHVDYFWLVTSTPDVAHPDEIPELWGLLVLQDDNLKERKKAQFIHPTGRVLDRSFIAAVLRRAREQKTTSGIVRAAYERGYRDGLKRDEENKTHDLETARLEAIRAKEALEAFERASGLSVNSWNAGKIGHAVELLMRHPNENLLRDIERLLKSFDEMGKDVRAKAEAFQTAWKAFAGATEGSAGLP